MDVMYGQAGKTMRSASRNGTTMDGTPKTKRRGLRRNVWVNSAVVLLLLSGALLGITQAFILLAIYALVIVPA
jgi:hypothetical protein